MPKLERAVGSRPVASAPYDTEEARSLLQVRLAQFGKFGTLTGLVFLVIALVMAFVLPLEGSTASIITQCGSSGVGALIWIAMRRGTFRTETLHAVDFGGTLAICGVFFALAWALPRCARPDLVQLICISDILMLRAFLVPSTPLRTAVTGVVAAVAFLVS